MKTLPRETPDPVALVQAAFASIQEDEIPFDTVTDHLFSAAVIAGRVELQPTSSGGVKATVAGNVFEIALPLGLSRFRAVLARIGVICNAASLKNSFWGRLQAVLQRQGLVKDRYNTERRNQPFSYRTCVIPDVAGSPLYVLEDAVLSLRDSNGADHTLKVTMKNSPGGSLLTLEALPVEPRPS
jgi:hypothetical protein